MASASVKYIVHTAGPVVADLQRCAFCGAELIDYRGRHVMTTDGRRPLFYGPGDKIGVNGAHSFKLIDRPLDPDEEYCVTPGSIQ